MSATTSAVLQRRVLKYRGAIFEVAVELQAETRSVVRRRSKISVARGVDTAIDVQHPDLDVHGLSLTVS